MKAFKYIAAALFLTASTLSLAGKPGTEPPSPEQETGYLGRTSGTFDGSAGMNGLYAACQSDYGDGAVVCSTKQILESPNIANATTGGAPFLWVRPFIVGPGPLDYSGLSGSSVRLCNGASGTTTVLTQGFVPDYNIGCVNSLPAACCR